MNIFLLFALVFPSVNVAVKSVGLQRVEVSGFAVARDRLALRGNKAAPSKIKLERFIVRLSGNEQSQLERNYILVHYQWHQNEPTLPEDLFRRSKLWKMKLVRILECDSTVTKMIQTFNEKGEPSSFSDELLPIRLEGARDEHIPLQEILPCYLLKPSDIEFLEPAS